MMSPGKFNSSISEARKLLGELELFKDVGPHPIGTYSAEFKSICRSGHHIDTYNAIRDNLDYEFVLHDDSFFQFCAKDRYLRYCFIENPTFTCSKSEYLQKIFPEIEKEEIDENLVAELVKEEEYEQFLNESELNANLLYIRYDFDLKGYTPLLHSCSHIHIGMRESVRIPISKAITPLQFVVFCLKLAYPDHWKTYHVQRPDKEPIHEILGSIKQQNLDLTDDLWDEIESSELYLT